jgi:hypothetical protein
MNVEQGKRGSTMTSDLDAIAVAAVAMHGGV